MVMAITSTAWPVWLSTMPGEYVDEIGVADRDGERGVLGQIQVLAGQRRDDHAQCLRDDHEPQHVVVLEPKGARRLDLAMADRENACPHDLGDERGRIDAERKRQRHQLWQQHQAALQLEPAHFRVFEGERRAGQQIRQEGRADQQAETDIDRVKWLAGRLAAPSGPVRDADDCRECRHKGQRHPAEAGLEDRLGQVEARLFKKNRSPRNAMLSRGCGRPAGLRSTRTGFAEARGCCG